MLHDAASRPVPQRIPGYLLPRNQHLMDLKMHLAKLCGMGNDAFWVCEKSDGVRVLVLIVAQPGVQEVYLIDRKEDFYQQDEALIFPHQESSPSAIFMHFNTVLDGELVIDVDPLTGKHQLRLLAFDCMVLDDSNLMQKPMSSRYGRLKNWIIEPHKQFMKLNPDRAMQAPFEVALKLQELAYGIEAVFRDHLPRLQHGNDGLIFTSAEAPYTPGTDQKILKWKPPSENSIDFLLQLKFPPLASSSSEVDWCAKPLFMLMMNCGREPMSFFDTMEVGDEEWEEWKRSGEQIDDRVIEVVWNAEEQTWKKLRFRDDKMEGNFKTVVTAIINSIKDGVEAEELIARAGGIRKAWKLREQQRQRKVDERQNPNLNRNSHPYPQSQSQQRPSEQQRPQSNLGGAMAGIKR